eukprot:gene14525-16673_t
MSIVNAVDVVCENGYVFRIRAEYTVEDTLIGIEASHQKRGCRILDGSGKVADPGQVLGSLKGPILLTGFCHLTGIPENLLDYLLVFGFKSIDEASMSSFKED